MKEPLRRYEINHPSRCVLDKDSSLKELPGTAETPTLQPACDAWWGMHWQKLSDLGVLIWNVQISTCLGTLIAKLGCEEPLWDFFHGLSWSFLHHVPSNAMCMIHDDLVLIHYGSIDPVWIHYWLTPDPLFILGSHYGSHHSSISGSEVPTHFLQEPLDGSILGTDVRHQHHLRLRLFWWS